jgi:hypothetical protein
MKLIKVFAVCFLISSLMAIAKSKPQTPNLDNLQLRYSHHIIGHPPCGFGLFEGGAHFYGLAFSPDGRYLMVWADNRIDVWGTRNRQAVFKEQ